MSGVRISYELFPKLDKHEEGAWFVSHEYDYRQNWNVFFDFFKDFIIFVNIFRDHCEYNFKKKQTELEDTNSCYQLITTITISEKYILKK